MTWKLITVGASDRRVKCRICETMMPAEELKARLAPDAHDDRLFYYFHVGCLSPELAAAAAMLATRGER